MITDLSSIIRNSGLVNELQPPRTLRQQQRVDRVITEDADIDPLVARGLITPVAQSWYFATITTGALAGLKQVSRAGFVTRLGAHATTMPTSDCEIRLTMQSDGVGAVEVMTVVIPSGSAYGFSQISPGVEINSMAWLGIYIIQTGSAAGLSITAAVQGG